MNESEFEQHLSSAIQHVLPTFQKSEITHQRSFSIKFGHHNVIINGKDPGERANRGIYDILLKLNDKPIALLELKKPGIPLSNDDRDQGISYARLTDPITPITIVSNGAAFKVYDTYSKEEIISTSLDEKFFVQRLSQAAHLAKNEFKQSIATLVENDQRVLFNIINRISSEAFKSLTGSLDDVSKPIVDGFSIERLALNAFKDELVKKQFVILTGDPFVGKTNFLFQFFNKANSKAEPVLYINCSDFNYSVFRKLTNHFQNFLGYPIDEMKIKDWLLTSITSTSDKKLTVIFDHVGYNIPSEQMADLSELVDLFKMNGSQMIVATDNSNYDLLRQNSDRALNTIIGSAFTKITLEKFSTEEFFNGSEKMAATYNLGFAWGADYSSLYRNPRIWRILLSSSLKHQPGADYIGYIKAIPDTHFFDTFSDIFHLKQSVVNEFVKLTHAYLEDIDQLDQTSDLALIALNLTMIHEETALKYLREDKIDMLIQCGILEKRPIKGFKWALIPKIPELLAAYASDILFKKYKSSFKIDFKNAYADFLRVCEYLPYGELVGAKIVMSIGNSGDFDLFSEILNELLWDEPKLEISQSQKVVGFFLQKTGKVVNLKIPDGEETSFLSNGFPYLLLSHILEHDVGDGSENHHYVRFKFITDLTSKEFIIRNADRDFFHDGIPTLKIDGIGELVKSTIGIVEPIVQVLYFNLLRHTDIFEEIFDLAIEKEQYQTLHRMYIAARNVVTLQSGDEKAISASKQIMRRYEEIIPDMFA